MHQTPKHESHVPRVWIVFLVLLVLGALYLTEVLTSGRPVAGAASGSEPTFSLPGGYYDRDIQLRIGGPRPGGEVIFTVDGRAPSNTVGAVYTQPIRLSAAVPAVTVIRARAVLPEGRLGPTVSASYFVGVSATLPMMSLIVEPHDLWDMERGLYANPFERGMEWERPVDVTFVDKARHLGFYVPGGVRIHGRGSRSFEKKPLRLYFRQEYGISRLEYPLFPDSDVQSFKRLVLHSGGQDGRGFPEMNINWTLIRDSLAADLAFQVGGYATRSLPVLLFINGEPWGIYQIRERIDEHFVADHYGVEAIDSVEAPASTGESEHWDHLMRFIEDHSLAAPVNYAYVRSQVDVENFIDYAILQIYAANVDWPLQNVKQFRPRVQGGRWHWVSWDSDRAFGAYPAGPDSKQIDRLLNHDHPETGGRDVLLLRKLLENPEFLKQFLSRTADLLNTALIPQSVVAHIDALAAELEPDIAYETMRWSSSGDWASNVEELREFARWRPDFVRQHTVESFGLEGTVYLTFDPPTAGAGTVAVNGTLVHDLPWQGTYFQGIPVQVTVAPAPGYRFAGWDPPDLPQAPVITLTATAPQTLAPRFATRDGDAPWPGDVVFIGRGTEPGTDGDGRAGTAWFELRVMRRDGVDLRGWRVTDNDTKTADDEGSLFFTHDAAFTRVPRGTTIRVIAAGGPAPWGPQTHRGSLQDDLSTWDRQMVLYVGNGNLDASPDPGFRMGSSDNLGLLAPGPSEAFGDDLGIAFISWNTAVTPASFGVLVDGVLPAQPPGGR